MTATSVKDVGSVLAAQQTSGTSGSRNTVNGRNGFQQIWYNQSGKSSYEESKPDLRQTVKKTPGDSLKAKEDHLVRTKNAQPEEEDPAEPEEISPQQQEEVMSVLQTSAADFVEELAKVLEVDVQDVQDAMEELGIDTLDVLDVRTATQLFLNLTGDEDLAALVTDGDLYEDYRNLTAQLQTILTEASETLDLDPQTVSDIVQKLKEPVTETLSPEPVQPDVKETKEVRSDDTAAVNREQSPEQTPEQHLTVENPQNGEQKQKTASEADSTFSGQESRNQHQTTGDGEVHNVFLQSLEADKLQADGAEAASGTSGWSDETVDIMNQIMDYMKTSVKEDTTSLEMQLHPESLGTLQIHLASKGGVVTANFITQNETVKSALESQMIQLKESFEEQGVKVNAIEVTVQTHEFERNLDQGRGESKNREPARRTRIRRINLEEPMAAEDMEQADALAVDMLSAGGNTVDYTA